MQKTLTVSRSPINVSAIVKAGLCTGCGTCAGVCPFSAVTMIVENGLLLPEIRKDLCTRCGICFECCPGHTTDMTQLSQHVFGRQPADIIVGSFLQCYVGHSNDEEVRSNCSSGGIADELLLYALEKDLIDGAVVTRMKRDGSLIPEPFIAHNREEILSASRSKYCPAAVNMALGTLKDLEGKFGFVGLPCHVHGVRKTESAIKELREKVVLHVGLFCGHTVSFDGTDFLLRRLGVRKNDIVKLFYRGSGQFDSLFVELKNGQKFRLKFNRAWRAYWNVFAPFFFVPFRCLTCADQFNELADISIGDAWIPEFRGRKNRESVVIVRSEIGRDIVEKAVKDRVLSLVPVPVEKIKESQAFSWNFKKTQYAGRASLLASLGFHVPRTCPSEFSSAKVVSLIGGLLSFLSFRVSSSKGFRRLLDHVPLEVFRLYFGFFRVLFLLSRHR